MKEQANTAKKYLEYKKDLEINEISLIAKDLQELNKESKELKELKENLSYEIERIDLTNSSDITSLEKQKLEKIKLDEELNIKNDKLLSLTQEISDLETKKQLTLERKKYEVDDIKLENNILSLKEEELTLEKNIKTLDQEISSLNDELAIKNKKKNELDDDLLNITHKHYNLEASINTKNKNILELKNKIDILETNLEENSTLPYPVKQILNNPRFSGVHGTISSLINVSDKYLTALNISLGNQANVLVVNDEIVAKDAINYLKDNHLGRATFFPLNIIKERFVDKETMNIISSKKGYVDILDNLVENEVNLVLPQEYRNIENTNDLIILPPEQDLTCNLTFTKFFDDGDVSQALSFPSIRVIEDYQGALGTREEQKEEIDKAIAKFSVEIPVK